MLSLGDASMLVFPSSSFLIHILTLSIIEGGLGMGLALRVDACFNVGSSCGYGDGCDRNYLLFDGLLVGSPSLESLLAAFDIMIVPFGSASSAINTATRRRMQLVLAEGHIDRPVKRSVPPVHGPLRDLRFRMLCC